MLIRRTSPKKSNERSKGTADTVTSGAISGSVAVNVSGTKPMGSTLRPNNVHSQIITTASNNNPTNRGTTRSWYARSAEKSHILREIAETAYRELQPTETCHTETVYNGKPRVPQWFQTIPKQPSTSLPGHTGDWTAHPNWSPQRLLRRRVQWWLRLEFKNLLKPRQPPLKQTTSARNKQQTNNHYDSTAKTSESRQHSD